MKNQVIEALTPEHGARIIKYFKDLGVDTGNCKGGICKRCGGKTRYYGVINGKFDHYHIVDVEYYNAEIIQLPEDKPYPKMMMVWKGTVKYKRYVLCEHANGFIAVKNENNIEEAKNRRDVIFWANAEDIEESTDVILTMEEIAKLAGCEVENLKIKK